jgi:MFS family permease
MNNYRILTGISALFYVAVGISAPLITLYLESLGASYAQISLVLTSVVATSLLMNTVWGRLSDRLGRRKPLLIGGLIGMAAAYLLLSQAGSGAVAWAARVLEGACGAAFATLNLAIMGDALQDSEQRGRRMGIYRGIGSLAFALGAVIGGRLADAYSISFAFVLCAVFYLVAGLAGLALNDRPVVVAAAITAPLSSPDQPQSRGRRRELPLVFLAGVFLWMAAHMASTSMWPNYMATNGYSTTTISSLWGLAALIEMPAMFLAGMASDVVGRAVVLAAGGFLIALVQIGYLMLVQYLPALLGVQVIRGFGFGSYTTTAMTFTAEYGEQQTRGGRSGIFNTTGSAGQLAGMFMGGMIVQGFGFATLYIITTVLALGSALCFLVLRRQGKTEVNR